MREERPDDHEAAAPNYDADMASDAKGIAERLMASVPKPTLGSVRALLNGVEPSYATRLTEARGLRTTERDRGAARSMIRFLHTGNTDLMRAFVADDTTVPQAIAHQASAHLSDVELRDYMATAFQLSGDPLLGIGIYVGALLTRNGIVLSDVMDCASDPVFRLHAKALRATPATITAMATEVMSDVCEAEKATARKQVD